jgi:eukaryotic-like serine/threonine-protein kinase
MLSTGTKTGPYEILAPLGAGGMGEVYRARDSRLGRDVALKIIPGSFARDGDRLRRFEQEARAVAALNHPNILAVFDVGEFDGSPFLVSELLEGESLRAVLDRGPLPQRKTIEYGVQIAQGLAAAHEKSVVHRDLKPENIFITKDARVKILDFGLAKLAQSPGPANNEHDALTRTSSHTAPGVVMGTASYMAPEQVRGQAADPRTDIFAFGAVLYEMLSGQRAFRRDTPAETMTAILKEDPPEFSDATHLVSPALDRIIRRCLEKNPEQRFQSARDLSFALGALSGSDVTSGASKIAPAPALSQRPWRVWLAAAALVIASCAITWFLARRPALAVRMEFSIPVPAEVSHMALSNDGSMLAFVAPEDASGSPMIYVQRIGSPAATLLQGTEGASFPFWSPDAAYLGFFANDKLKKISVAGGAPQVLANAYDARGGAWGPGGVILYAPNVGISIWRINADGTGAATVTEQLHLKEEQTHRWPVFLPDGNHFLFWGGNFAETSDDRVSGVYVSSLNKKERRLVVLTHSMTQYDSSHLYYADAQRQLVSVPFDPSKATVSGGATVAVNSVGFQPSTYWAAFSIADNGTLLYSTGTGAVLSELVWMDRSGKELGRVSQSGIFANPTISPDGRRVSIDITDQKANNVDVWLMSLAEGSNSRFTFDPAEEVVGVWSRDGQTLAYRGVTSAGVRIILKRTSGLEHEKETPAITGENDIIPNSWSVDDQQILCQYLSASGTRLQVFDVATGNLTPFLASSGNQSNGMISPDGKWVAYVSDELGNPEVYVTSFPGAAGRWQISRGGGTEPRWRADGKEIYYLDPKGMLTAVPVTASADSFSTGNPTPLFQIRGRAAISSTDVFTYDVAKDGQRFLVNRYVKSDHTTPLTVVFNASAPPRK